ncbi:MAG: peptidyl-alpha-hydroxyglycine alpha-amidating lyase family protein [Desulfofustis sp.]|nr:peptidyl-alpha-hydroxyglycine alpha-amidating lyase family protein [Desulfofustis sp.]
MTIFGVDDYRYEELLDWPQLPDGMDLGEVVDVAVDKQDNVYIFCRGDHPIMIFRQDGTFLRDWGEGLFTRPHGITIDKDGVIFCVDDNGHWIGCFTAEGTLLGQIGRRNHGAVPHSGAPFNRPTKVALAPHGGDLYIADGYGNARVHKFSPGGKLLCSWGEYGSDPGQFNLPHSVCTDSEGKVYVADRENHRIQIFDDTGAYLDQWNNMHRPCGLNITDGLIYIGQLFTQLKLNADYPNIGACVSIHDLTGKRLAKLGSLMYGEGPGQFIAPHGIAVDSRGDIYIGEVSQTAFGSVQNPPRKVRTFRKLVKI